MQCEGVQCEGVQCEGGQCEGVQCEGGQCEGVQCEGVRRKGMRVHGCVGVGCEGGGVQPTLRRELQPGWLRKGVGQQHQNLEGEKYQSLEWTAQVDLLLLSLEAKLRELDCFLQEEGKWLRSPSEGAPDLSVGEGEVTCCDKVREGGRGYLEQCLVWRLQEGVKECHWKRQTWSALMEGHMSM